MKWFKEHKKVATIGLAGIFLLVLVLIGCGVAFSGSGNGSDQKEQEASVTDTKKETAEEEKSSDAEVKKEDAAKEEVSEEKKETKEEAKKEEKTEKKDDTKKTGTASATATTKKEEAKPSSSKSSSSSSTKKTETKANNSSSSNSSKPQHTHTWVAQTKNVYHEATGHYENKWVQDSAAWDEDQYTEKVVCGCGATFDSVEGTYGWEQHSIDGCNYGYSVLPVKTGTIHHEATGHNEQKWVQDSAEWTETVTTGYKCSGCGATK